MATNAHTEVPGHKAPFPPFQKETFVSQLVWFVIAFIALYVLIKKLAIPQIGGIIEARTGKIEGDLAEAVANPAGQAQHHRGRTEQHPADDHGPPGQSPTITSSHCGQQGYQPCRGRP